MLRRTPLKRGKTLARTGGLSRKTCLKQKRAKPRRSSRKIDKAHLAFVRTLPCSMCSQKPPSHAHHSTTGRGKGQKADDDQAFALCFRCHQGLHDLNGPFEGWTQAMLREWQAEQVAKVLAVKAA
jgi:hypothetical protein